MGEWRYRSTILNHGTISRWVVSFTLRKQNPSVRMRYEAGWAPEPVYTLWSRDKSFASAGNQTPAVQPVVPALYPIAYMKWDRRIIMNYEFWKFEGSGHDLFLVMIPPLSETTDETHRNMNQERWYASRNSKASFSIIRVSPVGPWTAMRNSIVLIHAVYIQT
jgi:hypothetical protein